MRWSAASSSNRNAASALASSVLPTPVGPTKRNVPIGRSGILEAGARAAHGVRDGDQRLLLADDAGAQALLHAQQLVALAGQHLVHRNAGPARDDGGDVFRCDNFLQHAVLARRLGRSELLFEVGDDAVGELAGAPEVALALRHLELRAGRLERLVEGLRIGDLLLFRLPARGQLARALLEPRPATPRAARLRRRRIPFSAPRARS